MIVASWCSFKYYPDVQSGVLGAVNTFVHCLMYIYYIMAAWETNVWWKKHLTQIQIVFFF